jgi:formylmethanofuran dehydrogenase subunit E
MRKFLPVLLLFLAACSTNKNLKIKVLDTDFSKGRLQHQQTIDINDLEKFHGHLCDGLVMGFLAYQQAAKVLYPNGIVDRTNLRIVSKPSPCLTDVAVYLSGARYQFNTFYVDTTFTGIYIVQRIDNLKTVKVTLQKGFVPQAIDSLGKLAVQHKLSPCGIDSLKRLEDAFTERLLKTKKLDFLLIEEISDYVWKPYFVSTFRKTDVLNKTIPKCR